jgi:ribose 5-phosphate isomerase A
MTPKQRAAEAAIEYISSDMVVGLGTGSTAELFIRALGERVRDGRLRNIRGLPTSIKSEQLARENGIAITDFTRDASADVTVDGADEIAPNLDLIKGLGGALLREKIVAQNSRRMIVIADASKTVQKLGTKSPLPVEVARFAHEIQVPFLRNLGAEPTLRQGADKNPFVTDNGNYIYDCHFPRGIDDPAALLARLSARAGIVDCGLFIGIASLALVADDHNVRKLEPR